jgi:protoporphyrinogen oxidase
MSTSKKNIGIVGGGLLGMTLSLRLSEKGFKVTLFEAAARTGGLASPEGIGDYEWDRFYHVILMSDANLLALLDALNLKEQIHWGPTRTGFLTDGHLYSMSNITEFLKFPPLNLLQKLRLGVNIFYASKIRSWERLESVTASDWLKRLSGSKIFEKIWLPLLKSKLGKNYQLANASFIWAIIARMYAARRSGLKQEMFGYVDGGYGTIVNRFQNLLDEIGVTTLQRAQVSGVKDTGSCVEVETSAGGLYEFDAVILTVPCDQIPDLCPEVSGSAKERFRRVTYNGVVSLALLIKEPLAGYYITNITEEWVPFTGVIEMTALVDRRYFEGNSLVYLPRYVDEGDAFWQKRDEEIREEFLAALESIHPSFHKDDVIASRVSRATHVFPIPTLNYSGDILPPTRTSSNYVFVVNSAQIPNGTMNVNEIIGLANRKADELAEILSSEHTARNVSVVSSLKRSVPLIFDDIYASNPK